MPGEYTLTRCAHPTLTRRRVSTYTVFGFVGYFAATAMAVVLARVWHLDITERLIVLFGPPLAFLVTVTIATAVAGHERIVFYQAALAAISSVVLAGVIFGVRTAVLVDTVTIGIGVFLVFGRIGCFSVACCHGTLGRGVVYGPAHVSIGFWKRWSGRPLWPVQLVESVASLLLVVGALCAQRRPGDAATYYVSGYAAVRFALELVRGDAKRPYVYTVSEAQWLALLTALGVAAWRHGAVTLSIAVTLVIATTVLVARQRRRELLLPPHLRELDAVIMKLTDGRRGETSLGVAVSMHVLPDGRTDWVVSTTHPGWNDNTAHRLADALWPKWEIVKGRAAGVIHVLTLESSLGPSAGSSA